MLFQQFSTNPLPNYINKCPCSCEGVLVPAKNVIPNHFFGIEFALRKVHLFLGWAGEERYNSLFFVCSRHVLCVFSHAPSDISQVLNVLLKGVPNRTSFIPYGCPKSSLLKYIRGPKGRHYIFTYKILFLPKILFFVLASQNGSLQKVIKELGRHPYLINRN
jgi:hypothetical protein